MDAGWKMKWTLGLCRNLFWLHGEASTIAVGFRVIRVEDVPFGPYK